MKDAEDEERRHIPGLLLLCHQKLKQEEIIFKSKSKKKSKTDGRRRRQNMQSQWKEAFNKCLQRQTENIKKEVATPLHIHI